MDSLGKDIAKICELVNGQESLAFHCNRRLDIQLTWCLLVHDFSLFVLIVRLKLSHVVKNSSMLPCISGSEPAWSWCAAKIMLTVPLHFLKLH